MSRRKQVMATYGRHRNRVVSIDAWSSGEEKAQCKNLFSSFSSSGDLNGSSYNESQHDSLFDDDWKPKKRDRPKKTNVALKKNKLSHMNKENAKKGACDPDWINNDKTNVQQKKGTYSRQTENITPQCSVVSESSVGSEGIFESEERKLQRKALKEKNSKEPVFSLCSDLQSIKPQKTLDKKANKGRSCRKVTSVKQRTTKKITTVNDSLESAGSDQSRSMGGMDFSEFEKFSLVISDTDQQDVVSPEICPPSSVNHAEAQSFKGQAFTSTPHMRASTSKKKASSLHQNLHESIIEEIDISMTDDRVTRRQPQRAAKDKSCNNDNLSADLFECSAQLDKLHLSGMSSIALSPGVPSPSGTHILESLVEEDIDKESVTSSAGSVQIRPCSVRLKPPTDMSVKKVLVHRLARSAHAKTRERSYNASQSLFDDVFSPVHSPPNKKFRSSLNSSLPRQSIHKQITHNHVSDVRNEPAEKLGEKCDLGEHDIITDSDDDEEVVSEGEEELSDIVEEDQEESEADQSEDDDVECSAQVTGSEEDDTEDVEADECGDCSGDTTRYTLANNSVTTNSDSEDLSEELSEENLSQAVGKKADVDSAYRSGSHENSSSVYHTGDMTPQDEVRTPLNNLRQLREELDDSCRSMRILTPVRHRKSGRTITAREKVLLQCDQDNSITFTQCINTMMLRKCVKIGEGVYGEVFKSERAGESVALKIIPIEGNFPVNDEQQKTFEEILPEIVISKELSALHNLDEYHTANFVQVKKVSLVKGSYPPMLLKQWDIFHQKKHSENDRPDMFPKDQLFIIFEFENCGSDLESYKLSSLSQAHSILSQVTCALAVAEAALQFEHRDLHWGNVLVKPTSQKHITYVLAGEEYVVPTRGVKVSIIDFTLSRLSKDGCSIYTNLAEDPTLFEGQGDHQFEVYRLMKETNGNDWKLFNAFSNVLWIHYLADKLIHNKVYPSKANPLHNMRLFRTFLREALDYNSAVHLYHECSFFDIDDD